MRRTSKSLIAFVTAAALPLIAVAPASASSPNLSSFTFDCAEHIYDDFEIPIYGNSITVDFVNCGTGGYVFDSGNTGNASTVEGYVASLNPRTMDTTTITGPLEMQLFAGNSAANGLQPDEYFANLHVVEPFDMPNPDGMQLAKSSQKLSTRPLVATYGTPEEIDAGDEIAIGDIVGCEMKPGPHVYAVQPFSVSTAGDYTFRVTGVNPASAYLNRLTFAGSELDDPMVALYSTFDPASPAEGIVGCNDDLNDQTLGGHDYGQNDYNRSAQGDAIEGHFSYFSTSLEPGNYSMVFTTWTSLSASEWRSNAPRGGKVYFDVWGPNSGLVLADEPLATTGGVDPSFALWSSLMLVGVGVVIARNRSRERV
jgi:hypothetical protein